MGIFWSPLSGLKGVKPPVEFSERTRDCSLGPAGKEGPHLAMTVESRGFFRAAAGVWCFSRVHGDLREPLVWRQENPVFLSSCELELGIALQSLQGKIDLIYACVQDLVFHYWAQSFL